MLTSINSHAQHSFVIPIAQIVAAWPFWTSQHYSVDPPLNRAAPSSPEIVGAFVDLAKKYDDTVFLAPNIKPKLLENVRKYIPATEEILVIIDNTDGVEAAANFACVLTARGIYCRATNKRVFEMSWNNAGANLKTGSFGVIDEWGLVVGALIDTYNNEVGIQELLARLRKICKV